MPEVNLENNNKIIPYSTPIIENQEQPFQTTQSKVSKVVFEQSIFKGALWSLAALVLGSATLGALGYTLILSSLIVAPLTAPIPLAFGCTTGMLGSWTNTCIHNAYYHLGSTHKVIISQN